MDLSNLQSLVSLISPRGWQHLSDVIDNIVNNFPELNLTSKQTKLELMLPSTREYEIETRTTRPLSNKSIQTNKLKENPYSNKAFKDSGFDPYGGFFKTPHATMHNAYVEAYKDSGTVKVDSNFLDIECVIYAHFKLSQDIIKQMVAGYLAMTTLLKKPAYGKGPNVLASINGLKIALMPDLKLATTSGADSFGVYHFAGKLDYILMNSEIKSNVINEFNTITREKIWNYSSSLKVAKDVQPQDFTMYKEKIMLITVTMLHELGHRVEKKCLSKQQAELHNFWTKYQNQAPISDYGIHNPKEWFAECWAAWVVDGLSYSEGVKTDFAKLLFPPEHKQTEIKVLTKSGQIFDYQFVKNIFDHAKVKPQDQFRLRISYDVGPELEIAGTLIKIVNHEIPTIKYNDNISLKTLNFFPNRKIVNIKCDRL